MLIDLGILSLQAGYRDGRFTPQDVLAQIRNGIEQSASHNIWISVLDEAEVDGYVKKLGNSDPLDHPLWGIPFAIKDNIDLAGCPTTAACPDYAYTPRESATVVTRLIEAGAIPIGKTNLDQFATGLVGTRSPYGPTANAIDPSFISGGSSAGSAVAVKLALCSFALGTDTAGSGRIPAGFNGIVGLKPTKGWWSTKGVVPACKSLDCVSVFAQSVTDARLVADCCDGPDHHEEKDPWCRDVQFSGFNASSPRIGVIGGTDLDVCDDEHRNAYQTYTDKLPFDKIDIDLKPFSDAARLLYEGPWVAERYAAIESFIQSNADSMYPVTRSIIEGGSGPSAVDAFKAEYKLAELKSIADSVFAGLDVLVLPTAPTIFKTEEVLADPIDTNSRLGAYCNFVNLLDLCALSIPESTLPNGLPFGVTLVSSAGRDYALLDLAASLRDEAISDLRPGEFHLAVCGAHLAGQPLNPDLVNRGGYLVEATRTSNDYRLYALPDGKRPALIRDPGCGTSIEVEVWSLPDHALAGFLRTVAPPLGVGTIELESGQWVKSFIAEPVATENATEITQFGGWRGYRAS